MREIIFDINNEEWPAWEAAWNNTTTSIDDDGYPYPAITESNEN